MRNVIVIGAGMAGLTAARALVDYGFDVKILEARDRPGGRIWTDRSLGVPIDLGAGWIHGWRSNPLYSLTRQFGIPTQSTDYTGSLLLDDSGREPTSMRKLLFSSRANRILTRLRRLAQSLRKDDGSGDISIAEGVEIILRESSFSPQEMCFLNRHLIEFQALNAATLDEQSLFAITDGSCCFAGHDLAFPTGFDSLVKAYSSGLQINYGETLTSIKGGAKTVSIQTDKEAHQADAAVVTLPLGVLKSGTVIFDPPLPMHMQKSISEIRMGSFNKIAMRFPSVFWRNDSDFIEFIPRQIDATCQIFNWHKYTGEPVLIVCVAADTSRELEKRSDEEISADAMRRLRKYFGGAITDPLAMTISRWGLDPFSLGSYSVVHPGATSRDFDALAQNHGRLFFAGEATSREQQGTVHGAYASGLRAAQEILEASKR